MRSSTLLSRENLVAHVEVANVQGLRSTSRGFS
jgi:hypothetical protein